MSDAKGQQHEPSMEEILASIRKIISDDQAPPPAPEPEPVKPEPEPTLKADTLEPGFGTVEYYKRKGLIWSGVLLISMLFGQLTPASFNFAHGFAHIHSVVQLCEGVKASDLDG